LSGTVFGRTGMAAGAAPGTTKAVCPDGMLTPGIWTGAGICPWIRAKGPGAGLELRGAKGTRNTSASSSNRYLHIGFAAGGGTPSGVAGMWRITLLKMGGPGSRGG